MRSCFFNRKGMRKSNLMFKHTTELNQIWCGCLIVTQKHCEYHSPYSIFRLASHTCIVLGEECSQAGHWWWWRCCFFLWPVHHLCNPMWWWRFVWKSQGPNAQPQPQCRKTGKVCRFGFPQLPSKRTFVCRPKECPEIQDEVKWKTEAQNSLKRLNEIINDQNFNGKMNCLNKLMLPRMDLKKVYVV